MDDRTSTVIRRAASVAVVAGTVAVGTAFAATSANADAFRQNEASVLINVTPAGTDVGVPAGHQVGCRSVQNGCRTAPD